MSYSAMRRKRFTAGVLAGAMALTVMPILGFTGTAGALEPATGDGSVCEDAPEAEPFTDVTEADPSNAEIECLVNTGITTGVTATTYEPNAPVTRRQMALFLVRLADVIEDNAVAGEVTPVPAGDGVTTFTDVADEAAEIQAAIDRLADSDIAQGVTTTEFKPASFVTRRQMAKFIVRLQEFMAGEDITPDDAPNAFTDDEGDSGEAELNVLAAEGVFLGDGAGNVNPGDDISRRQMANVIIRKAQYLFEEGVITRIFAEDDGTGGIVVDDTGGTPAGTLAFDTAAGLTVPAPYDSAAPESDTFTVDGAAASVGAFDAALSIGDEISVADTDGDGDFDVFNLVNQPAPTSGLVGAVNVAGTSLSIVTMGNNVLNTFDYTADAVAGGIIYTVDGAAANEAAFVDDLSHGDTVTVTLNAGGDITNIDLVNDAIDGTVNTAAPGAVSSTFNVDNGLGDDPDDAVDDEFVATAAEGTAAEQVYTVDGAAATYAQFQAALTDGDTLTYTQEDGVESFALVNVEIDTSFSGTTDDNTASGADTVGYISGTTQTTFVYTGVTTFVVNGVVSSQGEFETALDGGSTLPWGEAISYNEDTDTLSLTTASSFGPNPIADVTVVDNADASDDSVDIVTAGGLIYVDGLGQETILGTTGTARWFVNGSEVTEDVYQNYLVDIAGDASAAGDSLQVSLTALATEYRLTTDNTLP